MFRISNLGVYLYHETMTSASLWIAVIVKYRNGECVIPSKIVNVNISETFWDVSLRVFTRKMNVRQYK